MKLPHISIRSAMALALAVPLAWTAGCSRQADPSPSSTSAANATRPDGAASLGDLTPFRQIAADVARLADQGDLPAAKTRIKDLEMAWDAAEAGLKSRSPGAWRVVDKSIDEALAALRAPVPNPADCRRAVAAMLQAMDANGKA